MRFYFSVFSLWFFFFPALEASQVGNPAAPTLFQDGIFTAKNRSLTLRFGYYFDNIYKARFQNEVISLESSSSFAKLQNNSAIMAINIKRVFDLYGLVGQARFQFDNTFYSQKNLSWGAGAKWTLLKYKNFRLGLDGKYFHTRQTTDFLVTETMPALIATKNFAFIYEEAQGALAVAYEVKPFMPYAGITYLYARISADPPRGGLLLFAVDPEYPRDFHCSRVINTKHWGFVLGVSLVSKEKIALNLESRMVDQNALNVSAEVCF
jgi:hypothetical protein